MEFKVGDVVINRDGDDWYRNIVTKIDEMFYIVTCFGSKDDPNTYNENVSLIKSGCHFELDIEYIKKKQWNNELKEIYG